ncbi:MAG: protein kinase family protein [Nocardiopsaceae bacterium]|nr:protein kinase family protein [Nocardiopsaceae bacterium]
MEHTTTGNGWIMWKAQDETLARPVSVLTFAPGFPRIPEVVTAARAASRLTDPRLAQVFDVEDGGDAAYVVMEWVSGASLADLIADGPMDSGHGCALVAEAARALAGAHAAGQAHLLLTPQSLRWTRSGGVKITGLGIDAALVGAGLADASDPVLTDTLDLAGLAYAALTGYWPRDSATSLPPAPVTDGEPCSPRQVSADVPIDVDAVVTRALLQRPVRQAAPITTPGELADALADVAPPVPLPEPVPVPPSPRSGYRQTGSFGQAGGGSGRPPAPGGYRPDPNDPWTWDAQRSGDTATYQRYPRQRGSASRAMVGVVAVLVLAAIATAGWAISNELGKSGGSAQAGGGGHNSSGKSSPATVLTPTGAESFDILGSPGTPEDPEDAANPLTGKSPAWSTQHYSSADFGQLKNGDGYLIEMGKSVKLSQLEVDFGSGSAKAGICLGNSTDATPTNQDDLSTPCPSGFTQVAPQRTIDGNTTFTISSKATGQDILIWFTQLTSAGVETISKVTVKGTATG